MQRKKTLADYWSLVLLLFALLLAYYAHRAPQAEEAIFYYVLAAVFVLGFLAALYCSKRRLGEFFSTLSGGR